jgi:hypothetical protein
VGVGVGVALGVALGVGDGVALGVGLGVADLVGDGPMDTVGLIVTVGRTTHLTVSLWVAVHSGCSPPFASLKVAVKSCAPQLALLGTVYCVEEVHDCVSAFTANGCWLSMLKLTWSFGVQL